MNTMVLNLALLLMIGLVAGASVSTTSSVYEKNENIQVRFQHNGASQWDWIGIFPENSESRLDWNYVAGYKFVLWWWWGAPSEGTVTLYGQDSGSYVVRLYSNSRVIASSTVQVGVNQATVWHSEGHTQYGTNGIVDFPWPEQNLPGFMTDTANLAVTVSGGGTRSYSSGFGALRALYQLGQKDDSNVALDKARYLAGISGGAWVTSIYTYHQRNATEQELLGDIPTYGDLTLAELEKLPEQSLGYGATRDFLFQLVGGTFTEEPGNVWLNAFSNALLGPYGLDNDKAFTLDRNSKQAILEKNPQMEESDVILPAAHAKRPYLILPSSAVGPIKDGSLEGNAALLNLDKAYTNIEATPLYTGYPLQQDIEVSYDDGTSLTKSSGGLIESFAFGGSAPAQLNYATQGVDAQTEAFLPEADFQWSIKRAAGASSVWGDRDLYFIESPTNPEDRKCGTAVVELFDPSSWGNIFDNWWYGTYCAVTTDDSIVNQVTLLLDFPLIGPKTTEFSTASSTPESNDIRLADGDVEGDPLGLLDVLVRNVDHTITFGNGAKSLCTSAEWDPSQDVSAETLDRCIANNIPPLFGLSVGASEGAWAFPVRSPERLQVFRTEDFAPFVKQLQQNYEAGNTAVARMTLETVENVHIGVPAGHTLDWCLFYLSSSDRFIEALPQETQDEIALGDEGKFASFPYYATLLQNSIIEFGGLSIETLTGQEELLASNLINLTPEQVNLLAALTSWAVETNEDLISSMFD